MRTRKKQFPISQRLIQFERLSQEQKQTLQSQFQQLNPLRLKEQIEYKLKMVFAKAQARQGRL